MLAGGLPHAGQIFFLLGLFPSRGGDLLRNDTLPFERRNHRELDFEPRLNIVQALCLCLSSGRDFRSNGDNPPFDIVDLLRGVQLALRRGLLMRGIAQIVDQTKRDLQLGIPRVCTRIGGDERTDNLCRSQADGRIRTTFNASSLNPECAGAGLQGLGLLGQPANELLLHRLKARDNTLRFVQRPGVFIDCPRQIVVFDVLGTKQFEQRFSFGRIARPPCRFQCPNGLKAGLSHSFEICSQFLQLFAFGLTAVCHLLLKIPHGLSGRSELFR